MVDTTTVRLNNEVKKELDELKISPRETYEDVLKRLIKILNLWRIMNC